MRAVNSMLSRTPVLLGIIVLGSLALTGLGTITPDEGPIDVILGSMVGLGYAVAATAWLRAQPGARQERFNPRTRWPSETKRRIYLWLIVGAWFAILFAAFTYAPTATRPALGALNVLMMWAAASYLLRPSAEAAEAVVTGSPEGQDASTFNWMAYLFTDEAVQVAGGARDPQLNTDGSMTLKDIPLDAMQQAWEQEQEYLEAYRNSSGEQR